MKIEISLLFLLSLKSASGYDSLINIIDDPVKYADVVCRIIKDITRNEDNLQDILMAKHDKNATSSILGDIFHCIGSGNPVMIANLDNPIGNEDSRKASIMILEFYKVDDKSVFSILNKQISSTVWNHMSKIIIIVNSSITNSQSVKLQSILINSGFFNVIVVYKINGKVFIDYSRSIRNDFHSTTDAVRAKILFSNKLDDLRGYVLRIPVSNEPGKVEIMSGQVISPMMYFFHILREKMNTFPRFYGVRQPNEIAEYWMNRRMEITPNTFVSFDNTKIKAPKLQTYEQNGYCALVPLPEKTSILKFIFLKPFDYYIWICIGLTVVGCMAIWRLFYNRGTQDSHWLLMFGMFAMFIGQGVEFHRTKRYVLVILLQLIIAMIFILSNGYQGEITSYMIQPEHENRLKTIKDLIDSKYKIMTSDHFANLIKDADEFHVLKSRMGVTRQALTIKNFETMSNESMVMILKCDLAERFLKFRTQCYYILQQHLLTFYEQLEASFFNPLIDKFQLYMNWSFQAGLQQAWILFSFGSRNSITNGDYHEVEFLKLKDLFQVFHILLIGYTLSSLVLLVEIFFHDFITNLDFGSQMSKVRKFLNKIGTSMMNNTKQIDELRPQRPKIRKIIVKPINSQN